MLRHGLKYKIAMNYVKGNYLPRFKFAEYCVVDYLNTIASDYIVKQADKDLRKYRLLNGLYLDEDMNLIIAYLTRIGISVCIKLHDEWLIKAKEHDKVYKKTRTIISALNKLRKDKSIFTKDDISNFDNLKKLLTQFELTEEDRKEIEAIEKYIQSSKNKKQTKKVAAKPPKVKKTIIKKEKIEEQVQIVEPIKQDKVKNELTKYDLSFDITCANIYYFDLNDIKDLSRLFRKIMAYIAFTKNNALVKILFENESILRNLDSYFDIVKQDKRLLFKCFNNVKLLYHDLYNFNSFFIYGVDATILVIDNSFINKPCKDINVLLSKILVNTQKRVFLINVSDFKLPFIDSLKKYLNDLSAVKETKFLCPQCRKQNLKISLKDGLICNKCGKIIKFNESNDEIFKSQVFENVSVDRYPLNYLNGHLIKKDRLSNRYFVDSDLCMNISDIVRFEINNSSFYIEDSMTDLKRRKFLKSNDAQNYKYLGPTDFYVQYDKRFIIADTCYSLFRHNGKLCLLFFNLHNYTDKVIKMLLALYRRALKETFNIEINEFSYVSYANVIPKIISISSLDVDSDYIISKSFERTYSHWEEKSVINHAFFNGLLVSRDDLTHTYTVDGTYADSISVLVNRYLSYSGRNEYDDMNYYAEINAEAALRRANKIRDEIKSYEEYGIEPTCDEALDYKNLVKSMGLHYLGPKIVAYGPRKGKYIAGTVAYVYSTLQGINISVIKNTNKLNRERVALQLLLYKEAYEATYHERVVSIGCFWLKSNGDYSTYESFDNSEYKLDRLLHSPI